MELCLIQSLPFFSTDAIPEGGLEIEPGFRIGSGRELLDAFIEKYLFKGQAGKLELDFLRQHPLFAYDLRRTPDPEVPVETGFGFAHRLVIRSQTFLIALWLVKDNGCNAGTAFLCAKNDGVTAAWGPDDMTSRRSGSLLATGTPPRPSPYIACEHEGEVACARPIASACSPYAGSRG